MQISPLVFQLDLPHASRSWCPWVANESVFRTASAGQSFGSFMFVCRCFLFSLFVGMFDSSTSMSFLTKEGCETVLLQSSPRAFCRHSFVMQMSSLVFQLELPHASRSCCPWAANASVFRTASAGQSFGSFMFFVVAFCSLFFRHVRELHFDVILDE